MSINRDVRKRISVDVLSGKIQISLRIRAVWSEPSLAAFRIVSVAKFLQADNEDSDQTARERRLIRVNVWRPCQKVRFLELQPYIYHNNIKFN